MEITRDALLRVVKSARMADRLARDTKALLRDQNSWTVADDISSFLDDAIFLMVGEKLDPRQDFVRDSVTMKLIRAEDMSDEEVTEEILRMAEKNAPKQPKPNLISRDKFNEMVERCGGYRAGMSEGEWPK